MTIEILANKILLGVFECGNGRISEILSKWLLRLGVNSKTFVQTIEDISEEKNDADIMQLLGVARLHYPGSCDTPVLLMHLCWDQMQVRKMKERLFTKVGNMILWNESMG